jgi:nucleoside-diphosphate-sugar epimerase
VARLLDEGHSVIAFDVRNRRNEKAAKPFRGRADIVWGDIRNARDIAPSVEACDAIIHNAGILAPLSENEPELAYAVNVGGTRHILEAMAERESPPVIVFSSTLSVCGPRKPGGPPFTADDPAVGTDHYTTHKAECERMLRESGFPYVILRIGVSVGPKAASGDFSPDVFRTLFGINPDARCEWVHPEDVALAQVRAIRTPGAFGKTLMIGGGEGCRLTFREFYEKMFDATGVGRFPPEAYGAGEYYTEWMDTTESQALLGFQRIRFDEFIDALRASYRFTRPPTRLVAPLIRRWMLQYSDAWQQRSA